MRAPLTVFALVAAIGSCTAIPVAQEGARGDMAWANSTLPAFPPEATASAQGQPAPLLPVTADYQPDFFLDGRAVQGGVMMGIAPTGTATLSLNGQAVDLGPDGAFLIGFDRDAANKATLTAAMADGRAVTRDVTVSPGAWKIEHVNTAITGGAKSSAEYQARRANELAQINAARKLKSDSDGWRQPFIWPVKGRISGVFGSQRVYQGTPGSYHGGLDIAVPTGTPYVAPADGVVILAAASPFTLEGNLLMIDHGMGLNSAFLHSSALLVKTGDVVQQGQVIGKVGATGRASGPHLHWGMKWHGARIDPQPLLPLQ